MKNVYPCDVEARGNRRKSRHPLFNSHETSPFPPILNGKATINKTHSDLIHSKFNLILSAVFAPFAHLTAPERILCVWLRSELFTRSDFAAMLDQSASCFLNCETAMPSSCL